MKKTRKSRPLLRVAALSASALLTACGSSGGETPLPGNPKGSHFDENATKSDKLLLSGTLDMGDPFPPDAKAVFISIKGYGGPPLAAKKLLPGPFPMAFELSESDRLPMTADQPLPDPLHIKVTLDQDGNATTKEDLPFWEGSQTAGATGVTITLRKVLPLPGNPKGSMYDEGMKPPSQGNDAKLPDVNE